MALDIKELLLKNRIVPVAVFENVYEALRIAELLLENGINTIEITLRTEASLECIKTVGEKLPEMVVGAGSVVSKESLKMARKEGAQYAVSPAFDEELMKQAESLKIPCIPGVSTPTELNSALKKTSIIKLFPAALLGGIDYIKAITAPFSMNEVNLVPTGGVNETNFADYLKLDTVIACGMTYLVDKTLIKKSNFDEIDKRIKKIISGLE
ncbi:MAG: bifunctional 4-hydroxy-2-oxoglutarate aldolase/2-dehydro-3-deoxy-phosphogluconate aldolase [bacterium]|nr:bifunctional 4-hydroxy-2-oxoglutarate aldolase/2-dehydro-3-deoxy-phosphogluconate aldolase [bacterium]